MPSYHYLCAACGPFEAVRPMAEFALPAPCPDCGGAAARSLAAPSFSALPGNLRQAHATNERSAHAPIRSAAHGPGCGCCKPVASSRSASSGTGAAKSFPGARPWMISH